MKRTIKLTLAISSLIVCCGCLVNRQSAHQMPVLVYDTNGVAHVGYDTKASSWNTAAGDAKQSIGVTRASATKAGTLSAGAKDVEQEASTAGLQEMFKAVLQMGIEMGKRSVVPPIP